MAGEGRLAEVVETLAPRFLHQNRAQDPALRELVRDMASDTGADAFVRQQKAIMAEAGYPEVNTQLWSGFFVPAGTPAPVVAKLTAELGKALADPGVQEGLKKMAVKPGGPTGDAFKKRIDEDIKTFADVAKAANLTFK